MKLPLDRRIAINWFVLFVILGCVLSYGAGFLAAKRRPVEKGIRTQTEDEDGDGKADYMVVSSNGLTLSISIDRNKDGQYDYRDYCLNGRVLRTEADNNFDGQFDDWATYYLGFPATVETDADGDGRVDIFSAYTNGVVSYSTIRITKGKRDFFTEYYEHGIRSKVVIQKDGKERTLKCGKYGEIEFGEE